MSNLLKLTWVETKLYLREPGIYFGLAFPLVLLFVFGTIYGNAPNAFLGGRGSLDFYLPAYIAMLMIANTCYSLPMTLINYRERGVLFRLQATPLRPWMILGSQLGVNMLMTTLGALLLVVAGRLFYNVHVTISMLSVFLAFLLGMLSIFSIGFLIASIVPNTRIAPIVGTLLFFAMLYLSGATVPLKLYPQPVQQIAEFIPPTHVIRLLQNIWFGASWLDYGADILVLIGVLFVCAFASSKLFRWR
jgi:ABC-2 type transport system permease protein